MIGLFEHHKGEQADPLLTIRFNPHTYHCFGEKMRVSSTDQDQACLVKNARLEQLAQVLKDPPFGPDGSLRVLYMYYDIDGAGAEPAHLAIWKHQEYCQEFRQLCLAPVCDTRQTSTITGLWDMPVNS